MPLKKYEKIALISAGPCIAVAGLFLGWSANYAGASFFVLKSTAMWKLFVGGDLLMPAKQFAAYAADARVSRVAMIATGATAIEAAVLGVGGFLLIKQPWAVKPPSDGSRFATLPDLKKAGLLNGKRGASILLGTFGKGKYAREVRYSGDSHFFVNGPSRSGKGRGFVLTNLLEYQGSVIVLDVKLENWEKTGPARLAMGQECFVFAPGSKFTHRWNPLDFVRDWPERSTDLISLSASLIPLDEKETSIWKQTARSLFAGVLGYVLESKSMEGRRNLRSALRLFSSGGSFSALLSKILQNEPELNGFIKDTFRQHLGRDEEQRPSFEGNVTTALAPFNNLLMAEATSTSDFDIRGLRRNPFSLFIGSPVSDFGTVEPILRLLIQQVHDVMLRKLPDGNEPHKILMMLDEFYQFERLPEIVKRAPLVAGYGMTIALIAQNIPQIDERYGVKTRDALLGNMDIKLNMAVGDDTTARIVSGNLGRQYVAREGWGRAGSLLISKQASQGRFELMPLMDTDAVLRLDDHSTILQIRGTYGAVLNKLNFYNDHTFVDRRNQVAAFAARMPKPQLKLIPEWPLFQERPPQQPDNLDCPLPASPQSLPPFQGLGVPSPDVETMDEEAAKIIDLARAVYRDVDRFAQAFRDAVVALDSDAAAHLVRNLRMQPDYYGPLVGTAGAFHIRGKLARNRAMTAIAPLRVAIIRARRGVINDRARLYVTHLQKRPPPDKPMAFEEAKQAAGVGPAKPGSVNMSPADDAVAPGFTASPSPASASIGAHPAIADQGDSFVDDALKDDPTDNAFDLSIASSASESSISDDTRIDFGLTDATMHVAAVASIAERAIRAGGVSDIEKLSGALARMNAGVAAATSDEPWTLALLKLNQEGSRHEQ